jgi:hypothetical protein
VRAALFINLGSLILSSMRDLLIKLRNLVHDPEYGCYTGLCAYIYLGLKRDIFTNEEVFLLRNFVKKNRPRRGQRFYNYRYAENLWYWPLYERSIRIDWLNYHINKLL